MDMVKVTIKNGFIKVYMPDGQEIPRVAKASLIQSADEPSKVVLEVYCDVIDAMNAKPSGFYNIHDPWGGYEK